MTCYHQFTNVSRKKHVYKYNKLLSLFLDFVNLLCQKPIQREVYKEFGVVKIFPTSIKFISIYFQSSIAAYREALLDIILDLYQSG